MQDIDQRDRELLSALQSDVPLASTPFAIIGQMIDMSEKEVIKRTERLKREGVVRHLTAHFDPRALGYRSSLVAARVSDDRVEEAAAIVSAHPGVTQNYRRNDELNLWFTIAVAPSSRLGLERTVQLLADEARFDAVRPLPTVKLYKTSSADGAESIGDNESEPVDLSETDVECVRILQGELPLQPRPFDVLARTSTIPAETMIDTAKSLLARGAIRRFGASVHPRKPTFVATAMGVWIVPAERADEVAAKMAQNRAVSHCYLRPVYDDWPYNLYTTIHGRSIEECESIMGDLASDTGIEEKRALFRTREFKQSRLTFFSREADEWEAAHASAAAAVAG